MADLLITVLQAFQLAALGPCLFVIAFLLLTAKHPSLVVIPVLYFLALSCSFLIPLLPVFSAESAQWLRAALLFGESLAPALCFLLILQFLYSAMPKPIFWLILAVPMLGGVSFIYGAVYLDEVCLAGNRCVEPGALQALYGIFSFALMLLLLMIHQARTHQMISRQDVNRLHKYWLIMALIVLSVLLMIIDLAHLAGMVSGQDAVFTGTIVRLGFIYLVLTSLFRVFDRMFELDVERIPTLTRRGRQAADPAPLLARIQEAMQTHKLYREMKMSRELMAEKLEIPEHQLSKLINAHFEKNFNEYINHYRIEEAKQRLQAEQTAVTTIAFEVGFNSIASFNRVFKDLTGLSPTEFRINIRQAV